MDSTENCREIVATFVNAIGDGRLDEARRLLHDDFVIHAAGDVPYSGDYCGRTAFFELLTKIFEVLDLPPRASGESVEMSAAEVVSIRDGLIVKRASLNGMPESPPARTPLRTA